MMILEIENELYWGPYIVTLAVIAGNTGKDFKYCFMYSRQDKKNNIEVLILDDKEIDEVITPNIGSYKDWDLKDVTSCEAPATEQTEDEKKEVEEKFKSIVEKITTALGAEVKEVKTTTRLSDSPSCVVKDANDPMAQMAQMMKAMGQEVPESAPILEINPDHAIVKSLNGCADEAMIETIS